MANFEVMIHIKQVDNDNDPAINDGESEDIGESIVAFDI